MKSLRSYYAGIGYILNSAEEHVIEIPINSRLFLMERFLSSVRPRAAFSLVLAALITAVCQPCRAQAPLITSVSRVSAQAIQTIVITGSGFGSHNAYNGDSSFISFYNVNKNWDFGYNGNGTGLIVESWTDSQIVLGGFNNGGLSATNAGDAITINVWNAQSGNGPAS